MPRSPLTTSSVPDSRVPSSRIRRECLMSMSRMALEDEDYMLQVEWKWKKVKLSGKWRGSVITISMCYTSNHISSAEGRHNSNTSNGPSSLASKYPHCSRHVIHVAICPSYPLCSQTEEHLRVLTTLSLSCRSFSMAYLVISQQPLSSTLCRLVLSHERD